MRTRRIGMLLAVLLLAGCTADESSPESSPGTPSARPSASAAASATLWLCRPGLPENPCEGGLDATVDGSGAVERFTPAADPPIDCFYVYPTVSRVTALNAPLAVDDSLVAVARAQAARFGSVCRVFAPVYRQITLSGLSTGHYEDTGPRAMAERDVEQAWADYLARDNEGRGVVLIGHSQGARTLTALLAKRIDPDAAARERLVSALLLGGDVTVAAGSDVGGSFANVPACRAGDQVGCVVAYSAFADVPPPDAFFGKAKEPGRQVLCVDPSRLSGDDGDLHPYVPTSALVPAGSLGYSVAGVQTGFVAYPEQLQAECRVANDVSYLHVQRAPGSTVSLPEAAVGPRWGLHTGDVNLALGDLVEVVRKQAEAYAAR